MSKPKLNLQALANTSFAINLALALGQGLPSFIGRPLAKLVADAIVRQPDSQLVKVLRTNLWAASGCTSSAAELDLQVRQVFRKHIRSLWDFYHNLNRPNKVKEMVSFSPNFQPLFDLASGDGQARLFLTVHTSNFELAGRVLALRGLEFQILSMPQPPSGYKLQNKIRRDAGMEITPMSVEAFQSARERLRRGGTVLTGIDRPLAQTRHKVRFFNRPALLPVAYVQLALQTGAPMIVVACVSKPDGGYEVTCTDPVIAQTNPDRDMELIINAEAVLKKAEEIIRPRPTDWCMFYPIWPELENEVPR